MHTENLWGIQATAATSSVDLPELHDNILTYSLDYMTA